MKKITTLNSYDAVPRKGVSWRAIFAGTVTVLSVILVLNLIGLAIGLGTIEPTEESNPLSGIGTGALIWWIVSNLLALFLGGFVAARVGVSFSSKSGMVQGVMTWALYTIISAWLLTSAVGSIISGVGNVVSGVLSTAGKAVEQQVAPMIENQLQEVDYSLEKAKQDFYALLEDTNKQQLNPDTLQNQASTVASQAEREAQRAAKRPGAVDQQVEDIFSKAKNQFENSYEALDKEALVNVLMERTDMSRAEAERTVENYSAQYEQVRQKAENFLQQTKEQANKQAENVAQAVSDASLYLAIALILGIIVAAAGGFAGVSNLRSDYEDSHYIAEGRTHYDDDRYVDRS